MEKTCIICGSKFKKRPKEGLDRWDNRTCCSRECGWKSPRQKSTRFKNGHSGLPMEKNPAWIGGRLIHTNGYIRIAIGKKRYRYEHRLVMEESIGRPLTTKEHVHHIDGDKTNNKIENLELMKDCREHLKKHHEPSWFDTTT